MKNARNRTSVRRVYIGTIDVFPSTARLAWYSIESLLFVVNIVGPTNDLPEGYGSSHIVIYRVPREVVSLTLRKLGLDGWLIRTVIVLQTEACTVVRIYA